MSDFLKWFTSEESGQGMVEYGLIIALVSIAVIVVLTTMGTNLKAVFTKIATQLGTAGAGTTP